MPYSTQANVNECYGAPNVSTVGGWGDHTGSDNAAAITAHVDAAIGMADAEIDAALRKQSGLAIPAVDESGAVPTLIKWMSARRGGLILRAFRGFEHEDRLKPWQDWFDNKLEQIVKREIDTGAVQGSQQ